MSNLYNQIKINVDKINEIILKKVTTEKIYKSSNWIAPFTGEIELYGVGKGKDGANYNLNVQYEKNISRFDSLCAGGLGAVPTNEKYLVVKGQSYEIKIFEQDYSDAKFDSLHCYFDGKLALGQSSHLLHTTNVLGGAMWGGQGKSFYIDRSPNIPNSYISNFGEGGMGVCGQIFIDDFHPIQQNVILYFKFHMTNISGESTKGGGGFLEISYKCQIEKINIFEDRF